MGSYHDFFDRGVMLTRKLLNHGFLLAMLKSSLRQFTVATMTRLTVTEYLCHKCPLICSTCRNHFSVLSSFMTYHRRVPLVEQGLLSLRIIWVHPYLNGFRVARSLVFCVVFCRLLFVVLSFIFLFGHCVVCPLIYGFWL